MAPIRTSIAILYIDHPHLIFTGTTLSTESTNTIQPEQQEYNTLRTPTSYDTDLTYKCPHCDKRFQHLSSLVMHETTHSSHRPVACTSCDKRFKTNSALDAHTLRIHSNDSPFACAHCSKQFANRWEAVRHAQACQRRKAGSSFALHSRANSEAAVASSDAAVAGSDAAIASSDAAIVNIDGVIMRRHECDVCGKCFRMKRSLKRHANTHNKVNLHPYDVCGKMFGGRVDLGVHRLVHTEEKKYECGFCYARFKKKASLMQHTTNIHILNSIMT